MKTLFEEDHIVCYFDEAENIIYHKWLKPEKGKIFREGLLRVLENFMRLNVDQPGLHWLADTQQLSVLPLEDQQWLNDTWNEALFVKANVKTHAVIVGSDVFARYAMEKFKKSMNLKYASRNICLETFANEEMAYDWFKKLNSRVV